MFMVGLDLDMFPQYEDRELLTGPSSSQVLLLDLCISTFSLRHGPSCE